MHELLLLGQVPASSRDLVLKIFAGITGMQPQHLLEKHLVYRAPAPQTEGSVRYPNKQNPANPEPRQEYNHHLVIGLTDDGSGPLQGSGNVTNQFRDLAEAGNKPVVIRVASDTKLIISQAYEVEDVTVSLWDKIVAAAPAPLKAQLTSGSIRKRIYHQDGHRFIHNNVTIQIFRILKEPLDAPDPANSELPRFEELRLLDDSGAYIVQASMIIEDRNKPEIFDAAVKELLEFKELTRGCVDLRTVDRHALDTRAR
ncbi:Mediator of RNA polymerase II transcription subunit 18 [Elasticomyces elasticus]|nr:Mediator of RNA polymerase II transcription subunit 18 [Elasticomyces elasticus]KAK5010161.1 hypothetical protein LTR28_011483 [Elasticomyces elasticus]